MNLFFEYIKYRWNAKGRHGTHSPFVYDFVDKCLKIKLDKSFKNQLEVLYNSLRSDNRTIQIADFGAGSKRLSNKRKVSQIFRTSSSKGKYGDLLFQLSRHYKPQRILEFGTSIGVGTIHLSIGNSQAQIITVEACPETRNEALMNFSKLGCNNIESIQSTFSDFLDKYTGESFDLVFVDGHHDGFALLNYMEKLEKFTHNDTIFVLDDIRWSNSMYQAWNSLIESEKYHVSLDLFRMGIIIKREQQMKESFTISL